MASETGLGFRPPHPGEVLKQDILPGLNMTVGQLAEFLEPWRPQRNRAAMLIHEFARGRPRRGPRMSPRTHLPGRTPGSRSR